MFEVVTCERAKAKNAQSEAAPQAKEPNPKVIAGPTRTLLVARAAGLFTLVVRLDLFDFKIDLLTNYDASIKRQLVLYG